MINTANELVFRAINAIEEGLGAATAEQLGFELDPEQAKSLRTDEARQDALMELKQNEIDNGIVKLESLLNATVDKDFDKFEIYTLRNILAVGHNEEDLADWVRLDHYKGIDIASADGAPKPEEVQLQRRKLHETAKLNTMLKAEEAKNTAILSQLSALIGAEPKQGEAASAPFAFLKPSMNDPHEQSLAESTKSVLDEVPALQQLLGQLRDAMQTIPSAPQARYDDGDSAESKRRHYLYTQGRRALERRGIDPAAPANASITGGRTFARDELEGIETIARSIGEAGAGQRPDDDDQMAD